MAVQSSFNIKGRNPDVLTCISNLSNDEVFTPPEFAREMLDLAAQRWSEMHGGEDLWTRSDIKFLDPFTKSGVFLREITARLTKGLESEIPDLDERVDHILSQQVFGIAITELTAQLARRSLYCSKDATGPHSIAKSFKSPDGNIWFKRIDHNWVGGHPIAVAIDLEGNESREVRGAKCSFCGANKDQLGADGRAETHAYALLHQPDPRTIISQAFGEDMQFDVIIGNPPYQLDDGGFGASAAPIYNLFVEKAIALDPRLLCMVIPARWFAGGKGLDSFRESMLNDRRIRVIEDFPDASNVFPGVSIKGGICYFLWERDNAGDCSVRTHGSEFSSEPVSRPLLEDGAKVFLRYNEALPILKKVAQVENDGVENGVGLPDHKSFVNLVSTRKHFDLPTSFRGRETRRDGDLVLYQNGGKGYISRAEIRKNSSDIDTWKVFIPIAGSGSNIFPDPILGKPFIGAPGTVSTETYNLIGPFPSERAAKNAIRYIQTKFMRFLVLLHKPTQHTSRVVYSFVPTQDFSEDWNDEKLFAKYGLTESQVAFIDKMVRPMALSEDNE